MIKAYKKVYTDDETLNRVQDNVEQTLKPLIDSAIGNGQVLKDITLTSGSSNLIEHKLDREPIGYLVIKRNAAAVVFSLQDDTVPVNKFLILDSSINVTVSLWVF